jgi:hypothetical protein
MGKITACFTLLLLLSILSSFCLATLDGPVSANAGLSLNPIREFSRGSWIENIAVRSNGHLLLTFYDKPEVWQVDPLTRQAKPILVYRFPSANGCLGITEVSPDKFAVIVGKMKSKIDPGASSNIWTLDLRGGRLGASQITQQNAPPLNLLNGLTTLSPNAVLAADTVAGVIRCINLNNGASTIVVNDTLGVNGVRLRGGILYYTNIIKGTFSQIPIDTRSGIATGQAQILAKNHFGADDFALDPKRNAAYGVNNLQNYVYHVDFAARISTTVAKSSLLSGATSAQFGRAKGDEKTLYVTTNGGTVKNVLNLAKGKIIAIRGLN